MTQEEEAKQKWCPFARTMMSSYISKSSSGTSGYVTSTDEVAIGGINRHPNIVAQANCIGSQCMAWQWRIGRMPPRTEGYCGLVTQERYVE